MSSIRVVVVDDHPLFRDGVIHTLAVQDDMTILGEGATAADAVRLAESIRPDVMLLDLNLEGDAMKAIETISAEQPSVNVLMLTVVADEECVTTAMRSGARGYVLKGVSGSDLADAVRTASRREPFVSPSLAAQVLRRLYTGSLQKGLEPDRFSDLTDREREILALLSQALSNKEIALKIQLTEKTVKHYLTSILKKLHVKNRVEAALLATHHAPATTSREGNVRVLYREFSGG